MDRRMLGVDEIEVDRDTRRWRYCTLGVDWDCCGWREEMMEIWVARYWSALFEKYFFWVAVSKSSIIYHRHVCDTVDHKGKVSLLFVIKQGLFFFVIYHKPYNVRMQECFEITCGKGCLCDVGSLWLILNFMTKNKIVQRYSQIKCQEIPCRRRAVPAQHSVINCGKCPTFKNSVD